MPLEGASAGWAASMRAEETENCVQCWAAIAKQAKVESSVYVDYREDIEQAERALLQCKADRLKSVRNVLAKKAADAEHDLKTFNMKKALLKAATKAHLKKVKAKMKKAEEKAKAEEADRERKAVEEKAKAEEAERERKAAEEKARQQAMEEEAARKKAVEEEEARRKEELRQARAAAKAVAKAAAKAEDGSKGKVKPWKKKPAQELEKGVLAGVVRPHKGDELALVELHRQVAEDVRAAPLVSKCNVPHGEGNFVFGYLTGIPRLLCVDGIRKPTPYF